MNDKETINLVAFMSEQAHQTKIIKRIIIGWASSVVVLAAGIAFVCFG